MRLIPETCFFTGHRVIADDVKSELSKALTDAVVEMAENGVCVFICGGALGFDTLAAQTVLSVRENYDIKLCLYLPCDDQWEGWEASDIMEYHRICSLADEVFYVNHGKKSAALMKKRNRAMVAASDYCICYLKNSRSGTAQTVRMAEEKEIEVINLYEKM